MTQRTKKVCAAAAVIFLYLTGIRLMSPFSVQIIPADRVSLARSPADLSFVSDVIVVARPVKAGKNILIRDSHDGKVITGYTKTTVEVVDVMRGKVSIGDKLTLTEECYRSDFGTVLYTQGGYLPAHRNTDYLLFLKAYEPSSRYAGMYFPVDLEYGKYVIPDPSEISASARSPEDLEINEQADLTQYRAWYDTVMQQYLQDKKDGSIDPPF